MEPSKKANDCLRIAHYNPLIIKGSENYKPVTRSQKDDSCQL